MERTEIMALAAAGESSTVQFKANLHNNESLAAELVAFSNTEGGTILVGVDDKSNEILPVSTADVARINQMISNVASENVRPSINPIVENIPFGDGVVMAIHVTKGRTPPYMDKNGVIWVKSGSDKRKATSREELFRMFAQAQNLYGDEMIVPNTSIADLDLEYFKTVCGKLTGIEFADQLIPMEKLLTNMHLMRNGQVSIAGAILLGNDFLPMKSLPMTVKVAVFPGTEVSDQNYLDSRDISGKIINVYHDTVSFCLNNIHHRQDGQSFNSQGISEIPRVVFEELVVNALVHRDLMVSSYLKVFVFSDRIEIISPGHLPNSQTIESILSGASCARNPMLASFAARLMNFKGFGSGIRRALAAYSDISFVDDRDGNRFIATIRRH